MRITANQLTLARIIFIPLPVALILLGDRDIKLVAWVLYMLIGITDFFDGMLARKYGSTKFGSLLDPIADKIYIALLFIPLCLLGYMPLWLVVAILIRDPIVTCLRSISNMKGITMKTASLAQYKTAIQMIAGCYIIWVALISDMLSCVAGLAVVSGLSLLWFAIYFYYRRKFHPKLLTLVGLVSGAVLVRYFFSLEHTVFIFGMAVLIITWVSGFHYIILIAKRFSSGAGAISLQWWLLNVIEGVAFPLIVLLLLGMKEIALWVPMTVLSLEFAVGALDNILTSDKSSRPVSGTWLKVLLQLLLAGVIFWKIYFPDSVPPSLGHELFIDVYLLVAVTLLAFIFLFARYGVKIIVEKT